MPKVSDIIFCRPRKTVKINPSDPPHFCPKGSASGFFVPCAREMGENVSVFRIPLPEKFGALSLSDLLLGADAGREAAAQGMEAALMRLGMPLCRVLPFRRKLTAP